MIKLKKIVLEKLDKGWLHPLEHEAQQCRSFLVKFNPPIWENIIFYELKDPIYLDKTI